MPNRIYSQYRDKPKAVAWYDIVPTIADDIFNTADQTRLSYDIDNANSYELDVIGVIVGVSRSYESQITFTGQIQYNGSGAQYGGLGIQYQSTGETITQEVSDEIYRLLIKAKISKNNNDATIDGMIDAINFIVSGNVVFIDDHDDMSFTVMFNREISTIEALVLDNFDILPRPQGVRFRGYINGAQISQYGSAQYGSAQYGSAFGV